MNLPAKRNLSYRTITEFLAELRALPRNESLMCYVVLAKCDEIDQATTWPEKRRLTLRLLEMYEEVNKQRPGLVVDYRTWPRNRKSVHGYKIGLCAVCGLHGEIYPPYLDFSGMAVHVEKQAGFACELLNFCDYDTKTTHSRRPVC